MGSQQSLCDAALTTLWDAGVGAGAGGEDGVCEM